MLLIVLPTYNERANLPRVARQLRDVLPGAHLLIVDDNSPDGTGDLADALARQDARIQVLHRACKEGLGPAYRAGFGWALARGFDPIVQMDADGSHRPQDVPRLLSALVQTGADVVIGSRYVAGGRIENWSWLRRLLSRGGNACARRMLGLPLQDLTGGFKAWRKSALCALNLTEVRTGGYGFQIEMNARALDAGLSVVETPIVFPERTHGKSKMNVPIAWEALRLLVTLRREQLAQNSVEIAIKIP